MARWRSAATERLPELRETIAKASNVMSLWIELQSAFDAAYRAEPRNDALIARIYSYANWCIYAPRHSDASHDPVTAVAVAFWEHIPDSKASREDMPRWFSYADVAGSRAVFSYLIGDKAFEELLEYMRRNEQQFLGREHLRRKLSTHGLRTDEHR